MVVVILTSFIIFNFPGAVWFVAKMHGLAGELTAVRSTLIVFDILCLPDGILAMHLNGKRIFTILTMRNDK